MDEEGKHVKPAIMKQKKSEKWWREKKG